MQVLLFAGAIFLAFGIGTYSLEGELANYSRIHLGLGATCLLGASVQALRGQHRVREALDPSLV